MVMSRVRGIFFSARIPQNSRREYVMKTHSDSICSFKWDEWKYFASFLNRSRFCGWRYVLNGSWTPQSISDFIMHVPSILIWLSKAQNWWDVWWHKTFQKDKESHSVFTKDNFCVIVRPSISDFTKASSADRSSRLWANWAIKWASAPCVKIAVRDPKSGARSVSRFWAFFLLEHSQQRHISFFRGSPRRARH